MNSVALEFRNVHKKFRKGERTDSLRDFIPKILKNAFASPKSEDLMKDEFWAVKDVSFEVRRGEALGIIGPNGAGKSTILKLLSGIIRPNQGKIVVNGRLSALIEVGAGFHPDLTGRENIYLNGAILGMKKREIDDKFDDIVGFSELSEFVDTPVKRYSSGMYARLGFSVAAHVNPEILLVDEVLSVGDFTFQHKCLTRMKDIVNNGTSVIFISHHIPSIINLCPKAILLNKGEVQLYGDSRNVCRHYYNAYSENHRADTKEKLSVRSTALLDRAEAVKSVFRPGEWGLLKVAVESDASIENLVMGFLVKRNDGMMVFDANSDKIDNKLYGFFDGETKEITVNFRVNLPEGTYFLGVHFFGPGRGFYFYNDELTQFYVSAPKTLGDAFMDLEWR
jgi:lipopolysaccharide transport system ATP-binding protein